jgi:signal peptidase II
MFMAIGRTSLSLALLAAVLSTIGCDRLTKHVASTTLPEGQVHSYLADTVRLIYVENPGGFLSLGADLPGVWRIGLFTFVTGTILLGTAAAAARLRLRGWPLIGVTLLVAGGASNWIDRVVRGSVVDFLNVGVGPLRTGVFNVADMAIMIGAAVLVLATMSRHED